jgi:hypothetical protein
MTTESETILAQCAAGVYPADLVRWLAGGDRGTSSETIVQHLTGLPALGGLHGDHPHDPQDLARCRKLLEAVPWLRAEFPRMASRSDVWARLVENWDDLCKMMDNEAPEWREKRGSAPVTYARMRYLIAGEVKR